MDLCQNIRNISKVQSESNIMDLSLKKSMIQDQVDKRSETIKKSLSFSVDRLLKSVSHEETTSSSSNSTKNGTVI